MTFAIMVVFEGGEPQYVCDGVCGGRVSTFTTKKRAQEYADFLREGMDNATVTVVRATRRILASGGRP